jgi:arylsulfatase A-like enzyme
VPAAAGSGKAAFLDALRAGHGTDRLDDADWAELVATYYGMVSRVDAQLGRVMDLTDPERTGTFFFTDHGEYLGDFGAVEKWPAGLDDCLLRNPLVAAVPGGVEGAVCDGLVEMVDLLPTLLDLAGATAAHTHFGRSLASVLDGSAASHRDAAFSEGGFADRDRDRMERVPFGHYATKIQLQIDRPDLVARCASIRTDAWTYVHRVGGADELYDRRTDPRELCNLASVPAHTDVVRDLRDRLLDWYADTSDVIPPEEDPRFPRIPHGFRST